MDDSDVRNHDRLASLPPLAVEAIIKPPNALGDEKTARAAVLQCLKSGLYAVATVRFLGVIPTFFLIVFVFLYRFFWKGRRRLLGAAIVLLCIPIYMTVCPDLAEVLARNYDDIEAGARVLCLPIVLVATSLFLSRTTRAYLNLLLHDSRIPAEVRRERAGWYRRFRKVWSLLLLLSAITERKKARDRSLTPPERQRHRVRVRELVRLSLFPWAQTAALILVWLPATLGYKFMGNALSALCFPTLLLIAPTLLFAKNRRELCGVWKKAFSSYLTGQNGPQHLQTLRRLIIGIAIESQIFQPAAFNWRAAHAGSVLAENARHLTYAYFHGSPWPVYHELLNLLLGFGFPLLFPGSVFLAVGAPLLRLAERALDGEEATVVPWEGYVQEMANSANLVEREHLWLGIHATQGYPVVLDRSILMEHEYVTGDSGSGKTSLGLIPLIIQLIRQRDYEEVAAVVTGRWKAAIRLMRQGRLAEAAAIVRDLWKKRVELRDAGPHGAVIVIDLKGDPALFETTRIEAERAGKTFKFFTNEINRPTYVYNPFQSKDAGVSLNQIAETFLEALGASHGEGYGRSYYSRVARSYLAGKLRDFEATYGRPARSFAELDRFSKQQQPQQKTGGRQAQDKERQDAFEIIAAIESLATFPQLNVTADTTEYQGAFQNAIYMPDVLENREVIYFWLPSSKESATVREIAKTALYDLLLCAQNQPGKHPVYLVIDEFQRIAADNFKVVLQQARSMQISIIASNQTIEDLDTPDADLRPTIQTNTRMKQVHSATDIRQQEWVTDMSGEYIDRKTTTSTTHSRMAGSTASGWTASETQGTSVSQAEERLPRLQSNDIKRISDDPLQCIVHVSRGSRYSQYGGLSIPVKLGYPYTLTEFNARRHAPWPAQQDGITMIARDAAKVAPAPNNGAQATQTVQAVEVVSAGNVNAGDPAQGFQEMLRAAQERIQQKQDASRPQTKRKKKEQA
jgi:hypothetical protein